MIKKLSVSSLLLILVLMITPTIAISNNDTLYYCDTFQNSTGIYCLPQTNDTINKNNISTILAKRYNESIIFLESGQNSTYINSTISDMQLIENMNVQFTATGFSQTVWSIKQEAYAIDFVYSHLGKLLLYIELLYKFDKMIYGLI